LKECGYPIAAVYDVNTAAAQALATEVGAEAATELKVVTALSEIIITVVTDDKATKAIYGGGLLSRAKGKIFINCATISPSVHVWVEQKCEAKGANSLEACMASSINSGAPGHALFDDRRQAGNLRQSEAAAREVERRRQIAPLHRGAGKAAQVKALVNMVMNINTAGLAEGLGLGNALGLDLTMLREVFSQTGANSRVLVTDGEDMQNRDHSVFLLGRSRREGFRHRPQARQGTGLESAARHRDQETIRFDGQRRLRGTGQIRYRRINLQGPG
jgi:3-hydroxyisobutyrate dehydrogenase